uniref:MADS-box domain-containing protein n=1 Tax=Oryza rufipogon TaxID=4529 RepID=A0A0E0PYD7_ORYRU
MGRPRGGTSKGKQKIEMCCIDGKEKRQVTFSKRRRGLFKKASEISTLSGASIAIVSFSKAGNVFAFGSPSVDAVLRRHVVAGPSTSTSHAHAGGDVFADDGGDNPEVLNALKRATDEAAAEVAAEDARQSGVEGKITEAMAAGRRRFWWDAANVEALGEAELPVFERALHKLRGAVAQGGNNPIQERWDRIPAQGSPGGSYGWEDLSPTGKLYNQPPFAYRLPVMQSIVSDQLGVVCAMLL